MTTLYWLLGGLAALIASGLASGAWGNIRKVLFRDFGGVLLKLYTFGNKQLETNLFKYISMRPKKDATLLLTYLTLSSLGIGCAAHALEGIVAAKYSPFIWLAGFMCLLIIIGHPLVKVIYCEFYTLRFDSYMALAHPYLSEQEYRLYHERFASMESKQQHMELCDEVKLRWKLAKRANAANGTNPQITRTGPGVPEPLH